MARSHASDGSERSRHRGADGVVKRSQPRHSVDAGGRPPDPQQLIQCGILRGGERRKGALVRMCLYVLIVFAIGGNVFMARWLFRSTEDNETEIRRVGGRGSRPVLRFVPGDLFRRFEVQGGLDRIRSRRAFGIRPPRLAVVLGRTQKDPTSVLLFTVSKGLQEIGYHLTIFAFEDGDALPCWEEIGGNISMLGSDYITDWSIFEGVILCSAEAGVAIPSLMHEPFHSVPVIWIIQEDTLGERLSMYSDLSWENIISAWRRAFSRGYVVVFPDFSLPLLYSTLDTGNFFVVPGSPVDVWAAESYGRSHSKNQLRKNKGIQEDHVVIVVVGSYFMYDDAPWDYVAIAQLIGSQLMELSRTLDLEESFQVIFLSGNSTAEGGYSLQDVASRWGFPDGFVKHYGFDGDADGVLLMADVVIYGSMHDEQSFPPLLVRAMSLGIPIIAPDLPIIDKYITNGVDGLIFHARDPQSLKDALRRAINGLSFYEMERNTAISGKKLSKNMLAWDCIAGYAKVLENVIQFPSDALLPSPATEARQRVWEWRLLGERHESLADDGYGSRWTSSILDDIGADIDDPTFEENPPSGNSELSDSDWADVREMELSEDAERREAEELAERTERPSESWGDAYVIAQGVAKTRFEVNERDEGELERVGRHLCIYETYGGAGAWPFLHRGALYRGLSLSEEGSEFRFDDVPAMHRLPLLNDARYKDLLCEFGGMLAIANKVDSIHKTPWIGFQSWRAAGRKVSLSAGAEEALTDAMRTDTRGDVFYFWAKLDLEAPGTRHLDFWSTCDILNNGHCRDVFQDSFRRMYDLPSGVPALPPMPPTGEWSGLHSWVMPTPSFMEFVLFSRMFLDSLDASIANFSGGVDPCLLGSSTPEKEHCFCRVLELLVNVWAYHSARTMIHLDPLTGELREQHPVRLRRRGLMWVRFFNSSLLKDMDEDWAESAADGEPPRRGWLWPLTGEVYGPLVRDREREAAYRQEKRRLRKDKQELLRRRTHGRYQRPLGQ
ncbi:unnamed protein product [Spirodela intermedia]|uniref:Glycosyl transferase family 1 domain-containing protein n=1 Tax=Spirodela intermedia TaxID=51605 RepID=A0A7I8LMX7_SPIIN|nr:unnamed protein product [Spirodela intermedia]